MGQYPSKVYLNGKIVTLEDAQVSVFDRGFLFGDGVYEVMTQVNGVMFHEKTHFHRLSDSLEKINIAFDVNSLSRQINRLLIASELQQKDCLLYIQITRGVAPRKHRFPQNTHPTVMMYALPISLPEINTDNISTITVPDQRWFRCDIKMISLLANVMANEQAHNKDAYEAILVRGGKITEASHCNVFFVRDSMVYTHPANAYILNGITRQIVLGLCTDLGIEVREKAIKLSDIATMDEAFLTGTTTQVASIRNMDEHFFYRDDNSGPVTKRIQQALADLKKTSNVFVKPNSSLYN